MSLRHQPTAKQYNTFDKEDMTDDSSGTIPTLGLKTPLRLRDRFCSRLSRMTAASVQIGENESMAIHLSRHGRSNQPRVELDDELGDFLQSMEQTMPIISAYPNGPRRTEAEDELWEAVLIYSYLNVDHIVAGIMRTFLANQKTFAEFMTAYFGVDDVVDGGSELDRELGDPLISLLQAVQSYDRSVGQLHRLIHLAWELIIQVPHLHIRLPLLLWKSRFGRDLYPLICTLAFARFAYHTFIRAAEACRAFSVLKFHLEPAAPSSRRVHFATTSSNAHAKAATRPGSTKKFLATPASAIALSYPSPSASSLASSSAATTESTTLSKSCKIPVHSTRQDLTSVTTTRSTIRMCPALSPVQLSQEAPRRPLDDRDQGHIGATPNDVDDVLAVVYPYLTEAQRSTSLLTLQSASHRDVIYLLAAVLRGNLLQISSNAWFTFGFVTTRDQEEERHLGGLYSAILQDAQDAQTIFREFSDALESSSLVSLFDARGYGHFRKLFPQLESFLQSATASRSTVWRLVQYIRCDGYTEPSPVIRRDFGFQFCRNHQDVMLLKDLFTQILARAKLRHLHQACLYGRIAEFAQMNGVPIELKHRHLLGNDYPYPYIGFDNGKGLERHRLPLFKSSHKL